MQHYNHSFNDKSPYTFPSEKFTTPLIMLCNLLCILTTDTKIIDSEILNKSLKGMVLALENHGYQEYLHTYNPSLSIRIRLKILAAPGHNWCSADFEESLHMSGATLRRHLAEEGTSLRKLLRETRLQYGLSLLKTTRKTVRNISQECGYNSCSCFSRNFISYFGIEPSSVTKM